jgi:hypothetical protein
MAAPSTCTTTGAGEASMRGLSGISCGPPATSSSRSDPEITGMRLRTTSATGTDQLNLFPGTRPALRRRSGVRDGVLGHSAPAVATTRRPSTGVGSVAVSVRALRHSE